MAVFNVACFSEKFRKPDPETGCVLGCGTQAEFQTCRQSFFLKQQNEILQQSLQQQAATSANSDQKIKDLESRNTDLQKITDQQNQQITQLIQSSEQDARKIENLNLMNTIVIAVLVVFACTFLVVKFLKRRSTSK